MLESRERLWRVLAYIRASKGPHLRSDDKVSRERPWEGLPPDALSALRPHFGALADEVIAAIATAVPAYARPLDGAFGRGLRAGVEQALVQFIEMARTGTGRAEGRSVYMALGRAELRAGRSLDALLAAYRVGARVAWRRLAEIGLAAGLTPETLVLLAESIFAYIDELSAESAEGFAREQAAREGEAERRRVVLIELLLRAPPAEPAAVADAAQEVAWRLPKRLAVIVWRVDAGRRAIARLPLGSLAAAGDELVRAVIPDPDAPGRREELREALGDTAAGMGSVVEWGEAAQSSRHATAALGLAEARGAAGLVPADEHLVALLCRADAALVAAIAQRGLRPLAGETDTSRARLEPTLLAWLRHDGDVPATARELHVHAQTVRYRLRRLRELFGEALDDPDRRFELEIALRAAA